jgi:hypothetical protein
MSRAIAARFWGTRLADHAGDCAFKGRRLCPKYQPQRSECSKAKRRFAKASWLSTHYGWAAPQPLSVKFNATRHQNLHAGCTIQALVMEWQAMTISQNTLLHQFERGAVLPLTIKLRRGGHLGQNKRNGATRCRLQRLVGPSEMHLREMDGREKAQKAQDKNVPLLRLLCLFAATLSGF